MDPNKKPLEGWKGLVENWRTDVLSGFLVFILALPLSMGIAQASDFMPIYGLLTAMIGGIVVAFFAGSPLTIKGPAAGLIVIVAGAVSEFGGGEIGWKLTLGTIVVAAVVQMIFGFAKLGKMSEFFPLSAVHGMLAAIGIIIMSKQFHGLLGQNPVVSWIEPELAGSPEGGKPLVEPFDLFHAMPHSIANFDTTALIIGLVCLVIVFGWPMLKFGFAKKIPAPLIVLLVSIPLAKGMHLGEKLFVHFDKSLVDIIALNADFSGIHQAGVFVKYVVMFALVGSLEALLTVKAIDMRDPWRRKSNTNKDLVGLGLGNAVAGLLGGLPMISEVARSSANVSNGARTKWANFFHGIFMLIFLLFAVQFSDLIPKPALSAMLIGVGFKLAHPREFAHMWHVGKEQLLIFVSTVIVTLATDLLLGIAAGILVKMLFQLVNGLKMSDMFSAKVEMKETGNDLWIEAKSSLVFSNYISLMKTLSKIPAGKHVTMDVSNASIIDHSTMENLHHFDEDYTRAGGQFKLKGLDQFTQRSHHKFSVRIHKKK